MAAARLTNWRLAAYGALGLPLAMAALPIYVHVPKFYADTLGLSLASVGGMLLFSRLFDAVQDPLLGWWSDRHRAKHGTRWFFIGIGAPLLALGMFGLFNPPASGPATLSWWLIANLLLVYTAFSVVTVSYQSHGAEIADDPVGRTRVTGTTYFPVHIHDEYQPRLAVGDEAAQILERIENAAAALVAAP